MRLPLCLAASALALAACSEAAPPKPAAAPPAPAAPSAAPAAQAEPQAVSRLKRAEVDQVLLQNGPPWVLRRILSEEVLGRDGKFTGWRLVGLPEEWRGVDLKPGDIVTRINGLPLETPDQAWEAWKSVAKAQDLRIKILRDGGPREVVLPIDGAPSAETLKSLDTPAQRATASAPAAPPPRRGSVTLGGGTTDGQDEAY